MDGQPTCKGYNALEPTRNDYVLMSPLISPYLKRFSVIRVEGIEVHSVLRCEFYYHDIPPHVAIHLVPPSLYDAFWKPLSVQDDLITNDPVLKHPEDSTITKRFNEYLAPFQAMLTAKITTNFCVLTDSVDAGNTTLAWNTWALMWKVVQPSSWPSLLQMPNLTKAEEIPILFYDIDKVN